MRSRRLLTDNRIGDVRSNRQNEDLSVYSRAHSGVRPRYVLSPRAKPISEGTIQVESVSLI
jgi:hypothetical protein